MQSDRVPGWNMYQSVMPSTALVYSRREKEKSGRVMVVNGKSGGTTANINGKTGFNRQTAKFELNSSLFNRLEMTFMAGIQLPTMILRGVFIGGVLLTLLAALGFFAFCAVRPKHAVWRVAIKSIVK